LAVGRANQGNGSARRDREKAACGQFATLAGKSVIFPPSPTMGTGRSRIALLRSRSLAPESRGRHFLLDHRPKRWPLRRRAGKPRGRRCQKQFGWGSRLSPPPVPTPGTLDFAQRLPWLGTARLRVGYTPADRWLVYATGGAAFGEIKTDATVSVPGASTTSSFSQDQVGWAAGAGVEAALGGGWTGKVEYLHVGLGSFSYSYTSTTTFPFRGSFSATSHVTDDIVRVGLNYRLGGAVMSKY
jgi:opacity protein-like surface antigen